MSEAGGRRWRGLRVARAAAGTLAAVMLAQTPASAQDRPILMLKLTRPDAKIETLVGRRLSETPARPPDDTIRSCGNMQISLRKLQYSDTAGFGYYFVLRHSDTQDWEEWLVHRDDGGRFTSRVIDEVKVFAHNPDQPECDDFRLPLYCLGGCSEAPWWTLSESAPKTLTIYVGAGSFWNLLLKKNIPFPAKIVDPALSMSTGEEPWRIKVSLSAQERANESGLQLSVAPRWSRLLGILLHQDGLEARLTYRSEVSDRVTQGVMTAGELSFPVVVKLEAWLLLVPLLLGSSLALMIRRLAWQNVRQPFREWALVALVAIVVWLLAYATRSSVDVASIKISADGAIGAAIVGLTTGLSGRGAVDRLYKTLGVAPGGKAGKTA